MPNTRCKVCLGDWNAKVGTDRSNYLGTADGKVWLWTYGERNERGERLLEFATLNNSYICSTKFKHKPSRKCSDEEVEAYLQLQESLDRCLSQDVKFVVGDWNAKVGTDRSNWEQQMGKFGYGERNERGERLLEFATLYNSYICSTKSKHKPSRKWTWESPNGRDKNMMILIEKRWSSSVCGCRSYPGADISSDHNLVLSSFQLSSANSRSYRPPK